MHKTNQQVRINKYLGECNVGSRRQIEQLLKEGKFSVNGITAEVGQFINTESDKVTLNGKLLTPIKKYMYIKLYKPKHVLSTAKDEHDRPTVLDYVKVAERLYPVGRLDYDSTGLILLTNDGELALKLTHPRYHLPKVYIVETEETLDESQLKKLQDGVTLGTTTTIPSIVKKLGANKFEITLYQGMKRQIREMCAEVGLLVTALHRTSIGPIKLGNLRPGETAQLTDGELAEILRLLAQ
ncbi:rRNA pseudouridine synthase [Patescibacteria group bacterium]|nr:rRNA pseudouridine synthase [Patescibacteria group bacterium]